MGLAGRKRSLLAEKVLLARGFRSAGHDVPLPTREQVEHLCDLIESAKGPDTMEARLRDVLILLTGAAWPPILDDRKSRALPREASLSGPAAGGTRAAPPVRPQPGACRASWW